MRNRGLLRSMAMFLFAFLLCGALRVLTYHKDLFEGFSQLFCGSLLLFWAVSVRNMTRICGGDKAGKIRMLMDCTGRSRSVADPWYTGDFDATWDDVTEGCRARLEQLASYYKKTKRNPGTHYETGSGVSVSDRRAQFIARYRKVTI